MTGIVLKYPSDIIESSTKYLNDIDLVKLQTVPDTDIRLYTEASTEASPASFSIASLAQITHTFDNTTSVLSPGELYTVSVPDWAPGQHILRTDKSSHIFIVSSKNYTTSIVYVSAQQQYACELGAHIVMLAGICTVQDTSTRLAFNKLYSIVRPGINIVSGMDSYILVIKPKPLET